MSRRALTAEDGEFCRPANAEAKQIVADLVEARDAIRQWKQREDDLKSLLLHAIGDDCMVLLDGGKVIAKKTVISSFRFSTKDFEHDHPDLYGAYKQPHTYTKVEV